MTETIKRNNGWIHRNSRLPVEEDGNEDGLVLVWHAFQDAMVVRWYDLPRNHFIVYWMRLSDLENIPWINAMERLPTQDDADKLNCVLVMDRHGRVAVTGHHQFEHNRALTHWRPLPEPPSDAKELRQMS